MEKIVNLQKEFDDFLKYSDFQEIADIYKKFYPRTKIEVCKNFVKECSKVNINNLWEVTLFDLILATEYKTIPNNKMIRFNGVLMSKFLIRQDIIKVIKQHIQTEKEILEFMQDYFS